MVDVQKMADAVFASVKGYVSSALQPLADRIKSLEDRAPERGEKGDPGADGSAGEPGPQGERGEKGDPGDVGQKGAPGERGELGPAGEKGMDGRDGRDGVSGRDGERGDKGMDGKDGRDGSDGKDGLGFDDLTVESDDDGTVTLKFVRGDQVKAFDIRLPVFKDRGVFRPADDYKSGHGVTYGGSFWIAQKDAPQGAPGASEDWRLAVKKGRDGKDGKDGDRGPQGEKGLPGSNGVDRR